MKQDVRKRNGRWDYLKQTSIIYGNKVMATGFE
jgi:hypothetical protein